MKTLTLLSLMVCLPFMFSSFTMSEDKPVGAKELTAFAAKATHTDVYITASYCGDAGISLTAHVLSTGKGTVDALSFSPDLDPNQFVKMRWYINGVKPIDGPVTPCVCGKYAFLIVKNGLTGSVDSYFVILPSC